MYRTYHLTEKDKKKFVISHWDGDCSYYTVCETEKEYKQEKERLRKIDEEYKQAMENYLKSLKGE